MFRFILIASAVLYFCAAYAHDEIPGAPQKKPVALINARIYTISHGIIENGSIVFDAGKITVVGRSVTIPAGAEVIDCKGKYVYPGFIAPITSLGLTELEAVRATRDISEVGLFNPNAKSAVAYNPDSELIPTVRSNGTLIANIVPADGVISGTGGLMALDGWTREDMAVKMKSCLLVNFPWQSVYTVPYSQKSADEQRKDNEKAVRVLYDYFTQAKAYSEAVRAGLVVNAKDIRFEAMRSVFEEKFPVLIAAGEFRQIIGALEFARSFGLNASIVGAHDAWRCFDEIKAAGVSVIVGRTHSVPFRDEDGYDAIYTLPAALSANGIRFAFSDDGSWQQRNLPFEAGSAIAFGLSEENAVRALTLAPAEIFGVADRLGSLEAGKDATLFVSSGNALDGRSNKVELAYIQGRIVSLNSKQTELAEKYRTRFQQR
ncbi:amidohydrolase [Ignavibacteria bacterium]|nr:amidohydrolase family protein [Bacteroidota bacterium]MCZ2131996.1 amidohydrolase family protein [Bacteroidota bacterium]